VRFVIPILCFCAGPAFAAGPRDSDMVRLDFVADAVFQSAIESHFAWADTSSATQHSARVSQKVRVALWTSHSILPSSAEVLRPKPPTALRLEDEPAERIAAKTVGSSARPMVAPYHLGTKPKRLVRPRPVMVEEDEQPTLWQRIVNTVLPGE
jgi:hypothetical protein